MSGRKLLREITVKKMSDGTYDVTQFGEMPGRSFGGSNLTYRMWVDVATLLDALKPASEVWVSIGTEAKESNSTLGTGRSIEDGQHRAAVAKYADDLERIKRMTGD